jgi:hypothetical protein
MPLARNTFYLPPFQNRMLALVKAEAAMPARFYYHLTDGRDLVIDNTGRPTRSKKDVEPLAFSVAASFMRVAPGGIDWSEWLVSVHDRKGSMVAVVPFPRSYA